MKNLFLFTLLLIILSCSPDDDLTIQNYTLDKSEQKMIESSLEMSLGAQLEQKININESQLKKIDDKYYLVSYSGDYRTTTLLKKNENKRSLFSAGVSCSSSVCSGSSSECIPKSDGKSCTACGVQPSNCTKTVTGLTRAEIDSNSTF